MKNIPANVEKGILNVTIELVEYVSSQHKNNLILKFAISMFKSNLHRDTYWIIAIVDYFNEYRNELNDILSDDKKINRTLVDIFLRRIGIDDKKYISTIRKILLKDQTYFKLKIKNIMDIINYDINNEINQQEYNIIINEFVKM